MKQNKALRVGRAEHGLSQYEVAHLTGISANRYWRIENGYAAPSRDEQQAIAAVLQLEAAAAFAEPSAA